ncbi:MAG: cytochrome c [Acidobacteria bacterium]|nr:cytochrome c [Acidobacteriota bacterium]
MLLQAALVGFVFQFAAAAASKPAAPVTFYKDVLPVLQKNCQECHRPGEAAPMTFMTYQQVRPWAKAIRATVLGKKMPPWFADPSHGRFSNARVLSQAEIDTLVAWADAGAPEGKAKDAPPPAEWVQGWNIGKPDLVVEIPEPFPVIAEGTIEYTYFAMPMNLKEDTWVQAAEVRPGARPVVHHVIAFLRGPESKWMRDVEYGKPYVPKRGERGANRRANNEGASEAGGPGSELLVGYAPGLQPQIWRPGQAKLVKAGTDVIFQMHYTANGKASTDQTSIGLVFAKAPPTERVMTLPASNNKFIIPAGADNHRVDSQITLQADSRLVGLMPHMHLRGKSFEYRAVYPTGETEVLLAVPKYDFNWQLFYYLSEPKVFPKGTRIECTAHFDNSANNKYNPDPSKEVRWGDQSWEEMMIGWFDIAFDVKMEPAKIFRGDKPAPQRPTGSDE